MPAAILSFVAVLCTALIFSPPLLAQDQVIQTITVGVVFVEFSDAETNIAARGGVGYTAPPRVIDNSKYPAQYWYDFFFKEEGHVSHPDSATHEDQWSGAYALHFRASLARWCRANSYGRHQVVPVQRPEINGILNNIVDDKIDWIRVSDTKSDFDSTPFTLNFPAEVMAVLDALNLDEHEDCDVVFIVYAGAGSKHVTAGNIITIPEKTRCCGSSPDFKDFILSFYMHSAVHEYIHAMSFSVNPIQAIGDYAYDLLVPYDHSTKRARWVSLSGMYIHGTQNRPYHLDPWAKLVLGWIDYQILTPGEYHDVSLPVIAQPEDGVVPEVLIIPIDVPWDVQEPNWSEGHYLIIENRRRIPGSLDENITNVESAGGFLVWEYDNGLWMDERGGLTLVEADGKYDMKFLDHLWVASQLPQNTNFPHQLFDPTADDFWNAPSVLSTWSQHVLGLLDPTTMMNQNYAPALSPTIPRQITIRFGEYADSGEENVIPYIRVGKPTSNVPTATRNNNQRKVIMNGDELVFVATSDFAGDPSAGTVTVYTSEDTGEHWTEMRLLNDFDVWRDEAEVQWDPALPGAEQDLNRWLPAIVDSGATAPSIARIEDSWGVVWQQREGNGQSRVLFTMPGDQILNVSGGSISRADDEVKPVLAWGRYDTTTGGEVLKVVYCTDDGLTEVISTDGGATFNSPTLIAGTNASSINPSLAMGPDHEILVYEEAEEILAIIDGATPVSLSALHPEFLRNMSPTVILTEDSAHVVWTAEVYEKIPGMGSQPHFHIKPVHKVLDIQSGPDLNVASFVNLKYGRLEEARYPVIATKYSQGNESEAVMMWSVSDGADGARLRYNEFTLNPATGQYEWTAESTESGLSSQPTYHPAIAGDQGEIRFVVTRGADVPYRIECEAPAPPIPNPFVGEKEVLISVLDKFDATWQNSVKLEDVIITSQDQFLGRGANAGIPFAGFDGSHDGPPMSMLSMSEEILLYEQDTLSWTLQIHRMPTNRYSDTTVFRVDMYDSVDSTVIASGGTILVPPDKLDTTFTVVLPLPPSHYPAAPVRLSLDVSGDAYDNGLRHYAATKCIYSVSDIRKRPRRKLETAPVTAETQSFEVYPQPAGTTLQLIHHMEPSARATVTLHDYLGRICRRVTAVADGSGMLRTRLDVADLRSGMYDCRISANGQITRRMVSLVR